MITDYLFYLFSTTTALSAIGVLFARQVVNAALLLIVCLVSIACVYILLNAEFVAVTQLLIYAGGVLVLIIFGIMITVRISGHKPEDGHQHFLAGILAGGALLLVLCDSLMSTSFNGLIFTASPATMKSIGKELITTQSAPFELAGLLLLVSLIGASLAASFKRS